MRHALVTGNNGFIGKNLSSLPKLMLELQEMAKNQLNNPNPTVARV